MPYFPCDRCGDVAEVTQLHHELLCNACRGGRVKADAADHEQDRKRTRRQPRRASLPAAQQEYAG